MSEISDEVLMSYADGALDDVERRRVDIYLKGSADGRARLEAFVRTAAILRREFAPVLHWPVPDALVDAIHDAPIAAAPAAGRMAFEAAASQPSLWSRLNGLFSSSLPFGLVATACSAALLIGGIAGWSLKAPSQETSEGALVAMHAGRFVAAEGLSKVLDAQPSKAAATIGLGGQSLSITPVMTFATADNRFCRQYDVAVENGTRAAGLACRTPGAPWTIEAHSILAKATAADGGLSRPAGANTSPAIDAAAEALIDGPALTLDREAALIASGWRN